MKRTARHDASDDDDNRRSVRVSSGLIAMSQAAAPDNDNDRRRVPRVIRNAVDGAWERPRRAGYSPAVPVQMACAHRWARYDDVVSVLRSLASLSVLEQEDREDARATVRGLYEHPTPFDADVRRFPEAEVFLSVDHGTFGQCMNRIQKALLRVEAATKGYLSQRTVTACEFFMEAVSMHRHCVAGGAREACAV